jgi:electron transfer flavoprotein alpha subunit
MRKITLLKRAEPVKDLSQWKGVWTLAEHRDGLLKDISLEILTPARIVAEKLNTEVCTLILGHGVEAHAERIAQSGADRVIILDNPLLNEYKTEPYTDVITNLIFERKPEVLLIGASRNGRDLSSRIAVRVGTGVSADCTVIDADPEKKLLLASRPAFGGRQLATIICPNHRPQIATARLGIFPIPKPDPSKKCIIEKINVNVDERRIRTRIVEKGSIPEIPLQKSKIIIAGGRGVGENGFRILKELADLAGGVVGASRAAVDAGWISREHQIGQTGRAVSPELYVACGISGAVQHIAGMKTARVVVAINSDPKALMFKYSDIGIVGDALKIVPELINVLKKKKTGAAKH